MIGALLHGGDELLQLFAPTTELADAAVGFTGGLAVLGIAHLAQVVQLAIDARTGWNQMVGQENLEGSLIHAMDVDPGHKGFAGGAQRPVDRAVLIHALVHVLEEVQPQPIA